MQKLDTYICTLQLRLPMMRQHNLPLLPRRARLSTYHPISTHPIALIRRHPHPAPQMHRRAGPKGRMVRVPMMLRPDAHADALVV